MIPGAGVNVEEHGARGVAGVGRVNSAAGELPEQPGVDGAEREFAGFGKRARAANVFENPGNLGGGEIGIDEQARALLDERAVTFAPEALAEIGGAAILPDDRVVDGLTRSRDSRRSSSRAGWRCRSPPRRSG